jgi:hypothetical protein
VREVEWAARPVCAAVRPSLPTGIFAFVVASGLLLAGWQLVTLYGRPSWLRARGVAMRHGKPGQAQTVKDRYVAWHEFRMGLLAIFGGAIGIASKYHTPPLWLVLVTGCAAVLVWDRARWLRFRQRQHAR